MKLLKTLVTCISVSFLLVHQDTIHANEKFADPNISSFINDNNSKFIVAELNTGKIIAGQNADYKVSYRNLINKIAIFALSEKLKNNSLTLEHRISISEDDVLKGLNLQKDISIKDIIFLLEQSESTTLANSVLKALNIELPQAQALLDKLTLSDTELNKLEISSENKISAKNLAYINQESLRNFYAISQITNQQKYTLENGTNLNNNITISPENSNILGLSHAEKNSEVIVNSGNTNFLIIILESSHDKNVIFENLAKLYPYLFSNYSYQPLVKSGNFKINGQDIIVNSEIYDLFYKRHDESNMAFYLMNDKVILMQNYETLSANNASVFSTYTNILGERKDIKTTFIDTFKKNTSVRGFTNGEKLDSVISNISFIIGLLSIVYLGLYSIIYIFKKIFRRN